jgi:SAM-dependent methyltransferase
MGDSSSDSMSYKDSIRHEWQRTARGWHDWMPMINGWLTGATELMLSLAGVKIGSRVLDTAAGDGGQSLIAAQRVGPNGYVLATDIAPNFVTLASQLARDLGLDQLHARVMDAEQLDLSNQSFDAVISRLGVMYLPNPRRGFAEMARVLRSGGRAAVIVLGNAQGSPFFSIPVSIIRRRAALPQPQPGQPGPFSLGSPAILAGLFREAGFCEIETHVVNAPLRLKSAAECVRFRREASGTLQQMLRGLDATAQSETWQEIEEALRVYEGPDGFESPSELLVAAGLKQSPTSSRSGALF